MSYTPQVAAECDHMQLRKQTSTAMYTISVTQCWKFFRTINITQYLDDRISTSMLLTQKFQSPQI